MRCKFTVALMKAKIGAQFFGACLDHPLQFMPQHNSKHSSLLVRNEFFVRFLAIFLFLISIFLLVHALLHTLFTVPSAAPKGEVKIEPIHCRLPHPTQTGVELVSPDSWAKPFPSSKVVSLDDSFTRHRPR